MSSLGLDQVAGTRLNTLTGSLTREDNNVDGTMFDAFLNSAIDHLKTTNSYLSESENEKIRFALGETENAHDLAIAMHRPKELPSVSKPVLPSSTKTGKQPSMPHKNVWISESTNCMTIIGKCSKLPVLPNSCFISKAT